MTQSRALVILGLVVTTGSAALSMALTAAPLLAVKLGTSPAIIGVLTASLSLLPMLLAVRVGGWVDRFGARAALIAATLLLGVAPVSVLAQPSIAALFVTEILLGLGNLLAVVGGQTFTAGIGNGTRHEVNFGWYTTFVGAGQIVGPLLAGFMAEWHGLLWALALSIVVAACGLAGAWFLPEAAQGRPSDRRNGSRPRGVDRAASLLATAGVRLAVVFTFSIAFAQSVFLGFFPVILQAAGISTGTIGALIALRAVISTLLRPFLGRIVSWLGGRRNALIGMVATMAASSIGIAASQTLQAATAVSVLAGIAWGLAPPLSIIMVVAGAAEAEQGFALGVRFTANRAAQLLGPLVTGAVASLWSIQGGFLTCGALIAGSLGYLWAPKQRREKPEQQ